MITTRINFNGSKVRLGPGVGFQKYQMLTLGQFAVDTIKARVAKGVGSDDATMKPLVDRYAKRKQQYGLQPIRDLHGPGQVTYQKRIYEKNAAQHFQGKTTKFGPSFYGWRNGLGPNPKAYNGVWRIDYGSRRAYRNQTANIRFRSEGGGAHMLDNFTVRYADELTVRMDITAQWARDRARANEQRSPWFGFSPCDVRAIVAYAQTLFHANVSDFAVRLMGRGGSPVWMDPFGSSDAMLRKVA
jgi:hypothetical protein